MNSNFTVKGTPSLVFGGVKLSPVSKIESLFLGLVVQKAFILIILILS